MSTVPVHYFITLDAAYRFYRTRCEEASVGRRGKASQKLKTKRRHERMTRVSLFLFSLVPKAALH